VRPDHPAGQCPHLKAGGAQHQGQQPVLLEAETPAAAVHQLGEQRIGAEVGAFKVVSD